MKFWKSLSNLIEETLPAWRDKFLSYKDLKKQLKLIYPKADDAHPNKRARSDGGGGEASDVTKEVTDFVRLLEDEIEKFNIFFVEKEEEYVIKLKELQDGVAKMDSNEELMKIGREIVDFHGEMILLENYSALNYTGLVKILKKYDKRSGALIRLPFIQKVLQEPFFTTDVLYKLVKECETMLDHLFSMNKEPSASSQLKVPKELAEIEHMESMYVKLTLSALRVLKEIRSGSSTVSTFSLPPLQTNSMEETWKKSTVLEQAAK
ncbi:unnamed protein product, partial [Vitis vinifera]